MSWKAYNERITNERIGKTCPVCGKHFFARSHQRLCKKCKLLVGKRRVVGREV